MRRIIATFAVLFGVAAFAGSASAQTTTPTTTPTSSATTVPGSTSTTPVANTLPGPNGVGVKLDGALTFSPSSAVAAGGVVTVNGTGLSVGVANFTLVSSANPAGVALGATVTVGADGVLNTQVTIPADTVSGTYYVRVIDATVRIFGGEVTVGAGVSPSVDAGATTVAGATTAPGALPFNGPLATLPVILGAALIGFAGVAIAQRSRATS
jgi:hypothetical protein